MKEAELTGRAREYFEDWRKLGLSESAAMAEVERSGIAVEQQMTAMFEGMGMSPAAARISAQGRDGGAAGHPFDQMVRFFEGTGLSHEAAKTAAIGPGCTEAEARREMGEAAKARMVQEGGLEATREFREAVRAAGRFHGKNQAEATTLIEKKIAREFASMSLQEGVAALGEYAQFFGSKSRKRERFAWAEGDLEEVAEDTDEAEELAEANTATVVELSEVLGRLCTGGNK